MVGWIEDYLKDVIEDCVGRAHFRVFVGLHDYAVVGDVILADEVLVSWSVGFVDQSAVLFC